MRNKLFSIAVICLTEVTFFSCSDEVVPDFTYTPAMPKCGQKITFTNLTHQ